MQTVKKILNFKYTRPVLAAIILLVTAVFFVRYLQTHPEYLRTIRDINKWTIVWILLLNAIMLAVLVGITGVTLRLCGKRIRLKENFLLTSYSSIANFFGPLQSGPGVRAVYLKARHQVRLRDYTLASLLALGLFASFSALFLAVGTRPWWQTLLAFLAVAGVSAGVIRLFIKRDKKPGESTFALRPGAVAALIVLVFLQVCVTVGWYYVELKAVQPSIHFSQAVSYAGAANFSLFVSVTPDAVGIREAFLYFSQSIHKVPTGTIVATNLIDRAAYVLFLLILFVVVISLHAGTRLGITRASRPGDADDAPAGR